MILRLAASDEFCRADYVRCLAGADFPYGLYHLVAGGRTNWHEYTQAIVQAAQKANRPLKLGPSDIHAIKTAGYPLPAPRPANSCLDTAKIQNTFGLCLPDWRQGLNHVKTTDYWYPEHERSLLWCDPTVGIHWPVEGEPKLAAKDAAGKILAEIDVFEQMDQRSA